MSQFISAACGLAGAQQAARRVRAGILALKGKLAGQKKSLGGGVRLRPARQAIRLGRHGPGSYDCSGLTMASWAAAGVPIPRVSYDQISQLPAIPRSSLQPGGLDGLVFRSEGGNPIQPSTWWRVWQKVRAQALTPGQLATPLMRRPYNLRHSGVTWRLNSGVPPAEIAAWAGHSVEVLMRVYAKCMTGLEDVWITRMNDALRLETPENPPDPG
jgi:hypothetical protein